ncbi:MAG TPA: serine/threonine-protein kinase [Telluria sp.]|jgi:hypothetical protein
MSALPPDDERTRMAPVPGPSGGAPAGGENAANALPAGARLGEFEILDVIGSGGFGIVYLAYDHSLERRIALKEYMPSSLAARTRGARVTVNSARHADTFQAGLRSFINEARLLARFDHPSLLKVYRFWEGNGTAYMVMPYCRGPTLTQALRDMRQPPDEAWLRALLAPLLDALETIHTEQCFHRDIAPDNILMLADDRPLMLDFGAARRAIAGMAQNFTIILKPGYAPIEQYTGAASMRQGPWTDIYALAAVVHFAITGRPPAPSVARMMSDPHEPLARTAAGRYSDAFLQVIDRALAVKPEQRPQSIAQLRSLLERSAAQPAVAASTVAAPSTARARYLAMAAALMLAAAAGSAVYVMSPGRAPALVAPALVAQAPPGAPAPGPAAAQDVPAGAAVNPLEVLDRIVQASNRDHAVTVSVAEPQVRIGKDRLRFSLRSSRPGYVYVLMVGSDRAQFWLLFPNDVDKDNRIGAGHTLELPRPTWRMDAAGPAGTDHLVAIVSSSPREFSDAGLTPNPPFSEFPLAALARAARDSGGAPVIAGKTQCTVADCPQSYGAALFSIEEITAR